jgi:hypothetical protein
LLFLKAEKVKVDIIAACPAHLRMNVSQPQERELFNGTGGITVSVGVHQVQAMMSLNPRLLSGAAATTSQTALFGR